MKTYFYGPREEKVAFDWFIAIKFETQPLLSFSYREGEGEMLRMFVVYKK